MYRFKTQLKISDNNTVAEVVAEYNYVRAVHAHYPTTNTTNTKTRIDSFTVDQF